MLPILLRGKLIKQQTRPVTRPKKSKKRAKTPTILLLERLRRPRTRPVTRQKRPKKKFWL